MNIKWTDKITNDGLWRITQQKPKENQIKKKENGIGYDAHYAKKQEQQRKQHQIGILRDTKEEVGRRERGEGQEEEIRGAGR